MTTRFTLAAAILAGAAAMAAAAPPAGPGQAPDCAPLITLSPMGEDGLSAAYDLCAPVEELAFDPTNAEQRRDGWSAPEGWAFDGDRIRRDDGAPFDSFALTLSPDSRFYDRRYMAIDRVGDGWTVLASALPPLGETADLRFSGFAADDVAHVDGVSTLAAGTAARAEPDTERVLYVGPPGAVTHGDITVIAGADIPDWLRDAMVADANHAMARMTDRFGVPPRTPPTLIVTYREDWPSQGMKGGVLDGEVVEMRIRRMRLDQADASVREYFSNVTMHEAAHFWVGHLWKAARNNEESWTHEGGAEYLSSRLVQDAESLLHETQERLNSCLMRADGRPMDGSQGPVAGQPPYNCGFAVMAAAEAASLRAGNGDIFDIWRAVGEAAGPDGFLPDEFLAEATARGGAEFRAAAAQLLAPTTGVDAGELARLLTALGIDAAIDPDAASKPLLAYGRALNPLLRSMCRGGFGFYTRDEWLTLDTGDRCGDALGGDPDVASVNGVSLMGDVPGAYAAIRDACAAGGELRFAGPDGAELPPVTCAADVPPMPDLLAIAALPDLPAP